MRLYADSSFLVSCYLVDSNTTQAKAYLSANDVPLPFTTLHDLEVWNAIQLGVFRGMLKAEEAKAVRANVEADLRAGRLVRASVRWPAVFRRAVRLSEQHARVTGTRSLDILHVAAAKALHAVEFASFDNRQRALGVAVGLTSAL